MRVTVTKDGPLIVTGSVPISVEEICDDEEGFSHAWRQVKSYPLQEQYALCRCGRTKTPPFCDGTHAKVRFDGTESGDRVPFSEGAEVIRGPGLTLLDNEHLCVHAQFCMRGRRIWNLVENPDSPGARELATEQACNCPSGRLVVIENETGVPIEPELEKSIAIIERPSRDEHGPIWVRGGIPVIGAGGKPYEIRNRVTLCRCGRSQNKPFCDGSHMQK